MNAVLGNILGRPWYAVLTGADWVKFSSPTGIDGLAFEVDGNLHILAVSAKEKGKGHFREFIRLCKREYPEIRIYEVWNPWLDKALERYGFIDLGEVTGGRMWRNPKNLVGLKYTIEIGESAAGPE